MQISSKVSGPTMAYPAIYRDEARELHPRAAQHRVSAHGQAGGVGAECTDQAARPVGADRQRPRHRVHLERDNCLVGRPPDRPALHCTRQAHAERHLRKRQRAHTGCVLERDALFASLDLAPPGHCALGHRLERATLALCPWLSNPGGLRCQVHRNGRSAVQPRPDPPIVR